KGTISGTATTAGIFDFSVRATDAGGCVGSQAYTITIKMGDCPTITLPPNTLSIGQTGVAYSLALNASGGTAPYTFTMTDGIFPDGLSLNSVTGMISGTPIAARDFNFTLKVTAANGCLVSQIYKIKIVLNCSTITLSPSTLVNGSVGVSYSQ